MVQMISKLGHYREIRRLDGTPQPSLGTGNPPQQPLRLFPPAFPTNSIDYGYHYLAYFAGTGDDSVSGDFMQFLAAEFSASMKSLNYLEQPLDRMKMVRSNDKNLRLYYLALFSRHETAYKFWDDVLRYGTDQIGLFGD